MMKMTYVDALDVAINAVADDAVIEKLTALKAQISKRNSGDRKPSKKQVANEGLKEDIFAFVSENGGMRANEIAQHFEITVQKASALLKQLVDAGRLEKVTEKKISTFCVAEGV